MTSSRRNFLILNLVLVALIGAMIWYLLTKGQTQFISLPSPVEIKPEPAVFSTEGLSEKDARAIQALQSQLSKERARAEKSRAQIQARGLQNPQPQESGQTINKSAKDGAAKNVPPPQTATDTGLKVEQQKRRIAKMIEAQLRGIEDENKRLTQALLEKNKQIEAAKQQNTKLAKRLSNLDNRSQELLNTLLEDGKNISSSDKAYLKALQGPQNDPAGLRYSDKLTDTDLINRVEVADTGDQGSITAELRTLVGELMDDKGRNNSKPVITKIKVPESAITEGSKKSEGIENTINALMARNAERESERRFQGDTLYDIADRVYSDGWLYHKIYEANPQVLNNPDSIKPAQRLRVPLSYRGIMPAFRISPFPHKPCQ